MSLRIPLFLRRLRLHCMEQLLRIPHFLSHVHPDHYLQRLSILSKCLLLCCRLQPILIILWLVFRAVRKGPRPCSLLLLYAVLVLGYQSPCLVQIRIDFSNYCSHFLQDSRFIGGESKLSEVLHHKGKVSSLFGIFSLCCWNLILFGFLSHRARGQRGDSRRRRNHLVRIYIFECWCPSFLLKM